MNLPVLSVKLTAKVTSSNLVEYKGALLSWIDGINKVLETDDDFAEAEANIKLMDAGKKAMDGAIEDVLTQAKGVQEIVAALREIKDKQRETRLFLTKEVKDRKDQIRRDIEADVQRVLKQRVAELESGLPVRLAYNPARIAEAMKGKKTTSGLRIGAAEMADAILSELAAQREQVIEAARILQIEGEGHESLFPDKAALLLKDAAQLREVITLRIQNHNLAQERKALSAKMAAEPARVEPVKVEKKRAVKPSRDAIINLVATHYGITGQQAEQILLSFFDNTVDF